MWLRPVWGALVAGTTVTIISLCITYYLGCSGFTLLLSLLAGVLVGVLTPVLFRDAG